MENNYYDDKIIFVIDGIDPDKTSKKDIRQAVAEGFKNGFIELYNSGCLDQSIKDFISRNQ